MNTKDTAKPGLMALRRNGKKTINLLATREDGFKVEGKFKRVVIEQEYGLWVNADGREFTCDKIVLEVENK